MKWWGKLKNFLKGGFSIMDASEYLVIVGEYGEVIRFIIGRMVPGERHYTEIKRVMAEKYPQQDYIITPFTRTIRIN